jgi:hypothetical protein
MSAVLPLTLRLRLNRGKALVAPKISAVAATNPTPAARSPSFTAYRVQCSWCSTAIQSTLDTIRGPRGRGSVTRRQRDILDSL